MSVKSMSQVWDLDLPHNELLVLLAMTDHADHDGENIYPSMGLIAWKTGYSERQVRRVVQKLVKSGILVVVQERAGTTKKYRFDASKGNPKSPYKREVGQNVTPDTIVSSHPRHNYVHPTPDTIVSYEPSVEPSVEPIADYAALPVTTGRIIKEKQVNPYYDAIKDILGLHGGQNGDMQKMLMGISKKNGYAAYNLSPAMDILDFIEWGKWAKKKLGQFMVKSPAKVNGYITEWRDMGSPKADVQAPPKPTGSMNAARAMAILNQATYEDSKNGND